MKSFDLLKSPLTGTHLIEAGAGTGKTYAIAGLYARLVLEQAVPVREILVVTFTLAATAELKDRIRRTLKGALEAFTLGNGKDVLLEGLVRGCRDSLRRQEACERLRVALRDFDEAAIFTIHGFCRRMLDEHAFESGIPFNAELVSDQQRLKEEVIQDFWRKHFYNASPELITHAMSRGFTPPSLVSQADSMALNPDLRILPEGERPSPDVIQNAVEAFREAAAELQTRWATSRKEVLHKLQDPSLKANQYSPKTALRLVEAMDAWLADGSFETFKGFEKMTPERMAQAVRKNGAAPEHPVFSICRTLIEKADGLHGLLDDCLLSLRADLIRTLRTELPARKQKQNLFFYDDLLVRFRDALDQPGGGVLAAAIRKRFKAALIDEFQDTDPIQYAIFHSLFGGGDHTLFLIGDPKQAIYSFRGADIFAYMRAAGEMKKGHTLDRNWRSEPGLVKAVNTLFSSSRVPFVYKEISFRPAEAVTADGRDALTIDGEPPSALECWFVPSRHSDRPLPKEEARRSIAEAVAAEISRLILLGRNRRAMIGKRPLEESDLAVLVRTHREAVLIQRTLRELRIPSVLSSEENVFDSGEARELLQVLQGIAGSARENMVRGALTTVMLGTDGYTLDQWLHDDAAWSARMETIRSDRDLWTMHGFMLMFRAMTLREGVRERLLSFPDGERRLTDLLHLAEILHRESTSRHLDSNLLLQWFAEQLRRETRGILDEHLLRLESDARAVRILTIHKSKGLEYPVVFCPFAWGSSRITGTPFYFHDEDRHRALTLELGSQNSGAHKFAAERERLAENCRLLYVALTRAKHRCYLLWGRINGTGSSALAYLFHGATAGRCHDDVQDMVGTLEESVAALSNRDMYNDLCVIAAKSDGTIVLRELVSVKGVPVPPHREDSEAITCRTFGGNIDSFWKVASYSRLVSSPSARTDLPDRDALPASMLSPHPSDLYSPLSAPSMQADRKEGDLYRNIHAFPGGTRTGILIHDMLEHLDFSECGADVIRRQVADRLQAYGFDEKWEPALTGMLRNVVTCPLVPPSAAHSDGGSVLTLSQISNQNRRNEMEFYFPLNMLSRHKIGHLRQIQGLENTGLERLTFSPVQGFMHGFIDLVFGHDGRFYLVDWKSNVLGFRIEDYSTAALRKVMNAHFYVLQARLYALALHQYLAMRIGDYDYDRHFGGVFYLFVRGMDPAYGSGYGVYTERPDRVSMENLSRLLIARAETIPS